MAPSLLELCGVPPLQKIHGRSWVKLVREGDPTWRKSFLYHYNYEKQFPYTPNVRCVRTESWKYSHSPHGDGGPDRHKAELYNIEFDPEERYNLIDRPKYGEVVQQMRAELQRVMADVGLTRDNDQMPLDEGIGQGLPDQKVR
jgi:N-acetylglucosamine-6-sulfatase